MTLPCCGTLLRAIYQGPRRGGLEYRCRNCFRYLLQRDGATRVIKPRTKKAHRPPEDALRARIIARSLRTGRVQTDDPMPIPGAIDNLDRLRERNHTRAVYHTEMIA